ncbi:MULTISPECIES: hypothetical protein [unclassified Streptomyces]|nr:hypothetical protein [Streptomyces sp. NBC_01768]WSC32347.1 hypothetical protein OG902_39815 [Streptomyces sp. NBC_01768]WSX06395.1 hypothetical protein OG355_41465 [Streptomyces sp. NBC_00987]
MPELTSLDELFDADLSVAGEGERGIETTDGRFFVTVQPID